MTSTSSFDSVMDITPRPPIVFVAGQRLVADRQRGPQLSRLHPGLGGELPRATRREPIVEALARQAGD